MTESNGWRTNFYYQQELRSMEMNGIFNSSLIPGVYNADISISAPDSAVLFNINIAAGTTLIFSNRVCTKNNKYYRQFADFSDLSESEYYTIKTTAENPVTASVPQIGTNVELPDRFFLVAVMLYGPDKGSTPIFKLAVPTEKSTNKPFLEEIHATEDSTVFYDGESSSTGSAKDKDAYLIIGEFLRTGDRISTKSNAKLDFSEFRQNYVFTRRGLEEYRYCYSTDKNTPALDFSYNASLNAVKVFWSSFMTNSILFKPVSDQRESYEEFIRSSQAYDISLAKDRTISGDGVVYDFIFATFQDTYQDKYDLSNLMVDNSYNILPTLYSCKWIQKVKDDTITSSEFNLSESVTPQLSLLNRIAGRPILSRIATAIKRGDTKVYKTDGSETTLFSDIPSAIIPVALVMRPFVNGVGAEKCSVGDSPKLNPDFVISYFDLYQGANECINIGLSTENIYSTVAILD